MPRSPEQTRGGTGDLAAVAVLFGANGLAIGAFGGSLPGLKSLHDLSTGQIVGVLVAAAVCAVLSMNLSGRLADRRGARLPCLVGGVVLGTGALVLALAPGYGVVLLGAAVLGFGNGAMDVSMNGLGVAVEQARGPVMSRLHASFSIGNLAGALVVVGLGQLLAGEAATRWSLGAGALLVVVLLALVGPSTPQSPVRVARGEPLSRVPREVWLLAAMAVCFGLTEGTGIDWSALHVVEVADVEPSTGAWGLACMSGFMVVIRLLGDWVVDRLGRVAVVRWGALCALVGYLLTATVTDLVPVLGAWCLVGLGIGLVAPQIYGLAGHVGGGRGLALVVSFGYAAFLVGPALIGLVAAASGLQRAMLVPAVTALGLVALSARMPRAGPGRRTDLGQ